LNPLALLYRAADRLRFRRDGNLGRRGEDQAHRYLRRRGFTVVARNWRPPQGGGEIDIIAWEGETLVFVEVKSRTSDERSSPERNIDEEKIRVLRRSAQNYIRRCANIAAPGFAVRFDLVSVAGAALEHVRNVFPLEGMAMRRSV
jgi:putative endonuclease